MTRAHAQRSPRVNSAFFPSGRLELDRSVNQGFTFFWLFNQPGKVQNIARPGLGDLSLTSNYNVGVDGTGVTVSGNGSNNGLSTGLVASQLGIGGNSDRSLFLELYWDGTSSIYSLFTAGAAGNDLLFDVCKYSNALLVGIYGSSDFYATVIPGGADKIVRVVLTYSGATKTSTVYSKYRNISDLAWTTNTSASQINANAYNTDDSNVATLHGSTFRNTSMPNPLYAVGIAPVLFSANQANLVLADPYKMLRPASVRRTAAPAISVAITGALAQTSGAATVTAAGSPAIGAALTAASSSATMSAAGASTINGGLTRVLSASSLVGVGSIATPVANLVQTTEVATLSAASSVVDAAALAMATGTAVLTSAGNLVVSGSTTETTSPATLAATGSFKTNGALALMAGQSALAAVGSVAVGSALGSSTGAAISTGVGSLGVGGTLTASTGGVTLVAAGILQAANSAALIQTSSPVVVSGACNLTSNATLAAPLGQAIVAAEGVLTLRASLAVSLPPVTFVAGGSATIAAALGINLGDSSITATGVIVGASGVLSTTLDAVNFQAVGIVASPPFNDLPTYITQRVNTATTVRTVNTVGFA